MFNFYASDHQPGSDGRFSEAVECYTDDQAREHARGLCQLWNCDYVWMQESQGRIREQVFA